jgi:alkaline phosphatase isozyme conversion protein
MKKHLMKFKWFLLLMVVLLAFVGCAQESSDADEPGTLAGTYLSELVTLGSRVAGTDAEIEAADWIESTLKEMGYAVTREPFTYTDETGATYHSQNLIAVKEGETSTQVVVGGHYDSKEVGVGADDNGSSVAVMLETAKVLQSVDTPQTIKFVFFGAEEVDRIGSFYHVAHMSAAELKDTILMVNFDSLIAGDISYVYGDAGENGKFRDRVLALAKSDNLDIITQPGDNPDYPAGTTGDWSDHAAFMEKGVPYIYFESTNWALGEKDGYTQVNPKYGVEGEIWHTKYDNLEYLEDTFPGRTAEKLSTFSQVIQEFLAEDLSKL